MKNKIFTFWEPTNSIPAYLNLCLESWRKYLPDYEIIILNYSNLYEWIDENEFDNILYEKFSLPIQADAIRVAILAKHGGIWMDLETIITSNEIEKFLNPNSQLTIIDSHIAFIQAIANSEILLSWLEKIKSKIVNYKEFFLLYDKMNFIDKFKNLKVKKEYTKWDYLGNSILNPLIESKKFDINSINKYENKFLPELNWKKETGNRLKNRENYRKFYFQNDYSKYTLDNNGGLICLHNSWTPILYKSMSKEEFLEKDNTLSKIFKQIL